MKLMFASDIHGSACYCEKMLECYRREQAERLWILGDILYAYMQTICIQHGKSLSISDRFAGIDRRCNINLQKRYTKKRVFIQTLCVTGFQNA